MVFFSSEMASLDTSEEGRMVLWGLIGSPSLENERSLSCRLSARSVGCMWSGLRTAGQGLGIPFGTLSKNLYVICLLVFHHI